MSHREILQILIDNNFINLSIYLVLIDVKPYDENLNNKTLDSLGHNEIQAIFDKVKSNFIIESPMGYLMNKFQDNGLYKHKIELDVMCIEGFNYKQKNSMFYYEYVLHNFKQKEAFKMLLLWEEFSLLFNELSQGENLSESFIDSNNFYSYCVLTLHELIIKR